MASFFDKVLFNEYIRSDCIIQSYQLHFSRFFFLYLQHHYCTGILSTPLKFTLHWTSIYVPKRQLLPRRYSFMGQKLKQNIPQGRKRPSVYLWAKTPWQWCASASYILSYLCCMQLYAHSWVTEEREHCDSLRHIYISITCFSFSVTLE